MLGGIAVAALRLGRRKTTTAIPPSTEVSVTLEELSKLWAKSKETGEIKIDDLAPIWRDENEIDSAGQDKQSFIFQNEKITKFFNDYIDQAPWFRKAFRQKDVCYQLLLLLEKEGDCPSVVNAADDVEASWDSNTYTLLGRTSLLDHTLNVAMEAINLLRNEKAGHVIPDTLVAALGHDLGKLPSIKGHLYSLGEHPLAAGRVLAEIKEFKQLARKEEISRAIKLHHKRPEGLIGQTLKRADQLARQKELEWAVEALAESNQTSKEDCENDIENDIEKDIQKDNKKTVVQPEPVVPPSAPVRPKKENTSSAQGSGAAWQAQADIYGEEEPIKKKKGTVPNRIDISAWFDAQAFLDALKPYINRITGRRFMAFSMSDGYVYFQAKAIEEVARKQAEQAGAMDVATMAADDTNMRRVLFTVVDHLRVEHGVIARELIKDQYFGGYFTITTGGKTMKGFYTPFHAESFGSIAEMENNKTGILQNFKSVEPYINEE